MILHLLAMFLASSGGDALVLRDGQIVVERPLARVAGGIEVRYENGTVLVPEALVHLALIAGEGEPEPRDEAERAKYAKGLVPFEGQWIARKRRDELVARRVAERRAEVADNLAHREWKDRRQAETKNFRFEYTVPQHVFADYSERLEAYFQLFAKDWRIRAPKGGKLLVCFYASPKEYYRTSGSPRGAIAYFKHVPPYELDVYYDRLDPTYTEYVLFHEANHYLQQLIDEGFDYPHWPGEALAEYYGASRWDHEARRLTIGLLQEGRLVQIEDDIGRGERVALRQLLTEPHFRDYTWGWSLVHFLMNHERHQVAFRRFFPALAQGADVRRTHSGGVATVAPDDMVAAFERYLGLKDSKASSALEREWHDYVDGLLASNHSTRARELGALTAVRTDRKLRAKRLFQEALEAGSTNAHVHHLYATLLLADEREQALALWRRALELAPLTGSYWFALGAALETTDPAESERLKKLGHELDPELDEEALESPW